MPELPFLLSTASLAGAAHRAVGRNNQDALAVHAEPGLLLAVVADGCSSSPRSEVGAALGARWLAEWVPTFLRYERDPRALIGQVRAGLLEYLARASEGLAPTRRARPRAITDFWLFTFLVAVVEEERALCFGLGDGLFAVNGAATLLDPGPEGAPPYLAYALIRSELERDPGPLDAQLLHEGPADALEALLIATDGCAKLAPAELAALSGERRFAEAPAALAEHLEARADALDDDATAALFRRR